MEPLTKNELDVLYYAAKGKRTKQIAKLMFYCESYVKLIKASALKKLKANNITHAVAIAIRTGLIK